MNTAEFNAMIGAVDDDAPVPTLDDYTVALETLRQRERITSHANMDEVVMAVGARMESEGLSGTAEAPIVKLCAECRWTTGGKYGKCICPSQGGYADRAGSDSFYSASVIRNIDCHGKWWEHGGLSASEFQALRSREMARRG